MNAFYDKYKKSVPTYFVKHHLRSMQLKEQTHIRTQRIHTIQQCMWAEHTPVKMEINNTNKFTILFGDIFTMDQNRFVFDETLEYPDKHHKRYNTQPNRTNRSNPKSIQRKKSTQEAIDSFSFVSTSFVVRLM